MLHTASGLEPIRPSDLLNAISPEGPLSSTRVLWYCELIASLRDYSAKVHQSPRDSLSVQETGDLLSAHRGNLRNPEGGRNASALTLAPRCEIEAMSIGSGIDAEGD